MRLYLILALASLWAAAPALAQESAILGGWTLPEGAAVITTSRTQSSGIAKSATGQAKFVSQTYDSTLTVMAEVEGGQLTQALQTEKASESRFLVNGRPTGPPRASVMHGLPVAIARDDRGWQKVPVGWQPDAKQQAALDDKISLDDADYPATPMAVGQTYVVPDSLLRQVYVSATDRPHRLTVRLDSLGTYGGAPAAFITQEVQVEVGEPDALMTMDMTARIVRRLDWMLDVRTEWSGETTGTYPGYTTSGGMRYTSEQKVLMPPDAP
ncbi:hypothetical protein [Rubricoccus marinus]|uniref:DUF3108 domain-containing protein n=1 Tax=Rubricoccus marinus TaxID=716817 RepID=A0A259U2T1_9BACT|nr:hypothetical protein [Rubricoccus marinus]OZC04272.1 hypothetical protein BSZ36_15545 [Rubricoccus marinus]